MRYWDASALVPLVLVEDTTAYLERLAEQATIVTWWLSDVEIASAIERRSREGRLESDGRTQALSTLAALAITWTEITGMSAVRERAYRLLATHALRATDAVQLAAALPRTSSGADLQRSAHSGQERVGFASDGYSATVVRITMSQSGTVTFRFQRCMRRGS